MFGSKKNPFSIFVQRRQLYEAFLEYLANENACEEELKDIKDSRSKEEFTQYAAMWNEFRNSVLEGEYDKAKDILDTTPYKSDMGKLEAKSVLTDLAEKTGNFNCYEMYWRICDQESAEDHDEALAFLNRSLAGTPQSKQASREHLFWLVNNSDKKGTLKYAEMGLEYFLKQDTFVTADDAADFISIARSVNPKSKGAITTEYKLFEKDMPLLARIRPLFESKAYDEIFEIAGGVDNQQTRRVLMRGACENKPDAVEFVSALKELYAQSKDPVNAYSAAVAIWNSDVRKNPEELSWSMSTALEVLDKLPRRTRSAATILDSLYLMEPYPLPDEIAKELAESVLKEDPENEIAKECLAIMREQAEKQK